MKKELSASVHKIPEITNDGSSSDNELNKDQQMNKLSETLSRSLRIEPPSLEQSMLHCSSAAKGSVNEPSTSTQKGSRSEWLLPIQTEQHNESLYPIENEQVFEPVFPSQQKSLQKWKPGRQPPLLTGTEMQVFRGQNSPCGTRSYIASFSDCDDIEYELENIYNDYEFSFQERRRRCQTRYNRVRIPFVSEHRVGWRKRIQHFICDIVRRMRYFIHHRST
ncbi:hypothetical protein TNIN_261911 [Trichonephila inaurata madagascariensis]|uniref:Uncharacterized protein n=1 Tax=Trichonephila inaurata madagascariensis TaxID=2747483 RepID=A0A8X6WXV2_9ARAC|nr:hypothetical protein TNIN_261911 [Trichonephila inaurata madagascariensis]